MAVQPGHADVIPEVRDSGPGLAIVRRTVERLGGTISLGDAGPGGGLKATACLPLQRA